MQTVHGAGGAKWCDVKEFEVNSIHYDYIKLMMAEC